ncbi:MAG: CocE/NonD family hydrolase [SAR202 cluster bacterium]|nr:CocE/NonD family hydrolase [SAR202 cluster bacterium]
MNDVNLVSDVMVETRDGVRLATDIYFPARNGRRVAGKLPALLHRTPYNKTEVEATLGYCRYFASHGYVSIIQDCRGCYRSGGDVNFLFPEAEDGCDTMSWIDAQPWSDGQVGTWGTSWAGWTQTALAALGPRNLKTMVPNMSGSDGYSSSIRQGGALELRFLAWAFWHSAVNTQKALKFEPWIDAALNRGATRFREWLTRMPIRPGQTQLKLVPQYERWAFELLKSADYGDYWKHPSLAPELYWEKFPDIPVLWVGGWYDSYARATFESFLGMRRLKKAPQYVLVGPWTHGSETVQQPFAGDVEFPREAGLTSFRDVHLRWFDHWLKGEDNGVARDPRIRVFVMGGGDGKKAATGRLSHGGKWRDLDEWPPAGTRRSSFYLHGDGSLDERKPGTAGGRTTYRFDPANPVPSIGGSVSSLADLEDLPAGINDPGLVPRQARSRDIMSAGGFDQREAARFFGCRPPYLPLASRPDVLVFQTDPLQEELEVAGPVEVKLWVATSAVDTDFTAKLIDVYPPGSSYPDGYALNLSDSIQRLRYRDPRGRPALVKPGEVVPITIVLYPIANLFARGHRIRLDVSSSNFPRFDVNPNTGEAIGFERRRVVAENTVFHDSTRPSHVVLPVA